VRQAIAIRDNMLISSGMGTGEDDHPQCSRVSLPGEDWLILIEDTAQMRVDAPSQLRFEARRAQGDLPAINIRDLLRATWRHWPDRLLVGEARGRVSDRLAASPGAATEVVLVRCYDRAANALTSRR
jgi:pilus assembly protein CpaF